MTNWPIMMVLIVHVVTNDNYPMVKAIMGLIIMLLFVANKWRCDCTKRGMGLERRFSRYTTYQVVYITVCMCVIVAYVSNN